MNDTHTLIPMSTRITTPPDLTRTLASARDLARDLEISLILRDEAGFIRAHVDATGNYRFV